MVMLPGVANSPPFTIDAEDAEEASGTENHVYGLLNRELHPVEGLPHFERELDEFRLISHASTDGPRSQLCACATLHSCVIRPWLPSSATFSHASR